MEHAIRITKKDERIPHEGYTHVATVYIRTYSDGTIEVTGTDTDYHAHLVHVRTTVYKPSDQPHHVNHIK